MKKHKFFFLGIIFILFVSCDDIYDDDDRGGISGIQFDRGIKFPSWIEGFWGGTLENTVDSTPKDYGFLFFHDSDGEGEIIVDWGNDQEIGTEDFPKGGYMIEEGVDDLYLKFSILKNTNAEYSFTVSGRLPAGTPVDGTYSFTKPSGTSNILDADVKEEGTSWVGDLTKKERIFR